MPPVGGGNTQQSSPGRQHQVTNNSSLSDFSLKYQLYPQLISEYNTFKIFSLRWNLLLEQISEQLRTSKSLLGLWQCYRSLYSQCVTAVHKQEERADRLLRSATDREITEDESSAWIKDCNVSRDETLEHDMLNILFCSYRPMPELSVRLILHPHILWLRI